MDDEFIHVGDNVEYECGNGGVITIIGVDGETDLNRTGDDDSYAYYDDLHIDAHNDMVVNVDEDYHVEGSVKHVTGDAVMRFQLSSREPNGEVDVKLTGLSQNAWYRLRFNGVLASCDGGRAHGKTNEQGILRFNGVKIPNE
jgi:hypothetical protein